MSILSSKKQTVHEQGHWESKTGMTLRSRMLQMACKVKMRTLTMVGYYNGDLQTAGEVESCYIIAYHFISLIITRGICKKKKKPKLNISYIHEICKMALLLWLNQFCPLKGSSTLTGLHFFILVILPFWSFFSQAQDVTK